MKTLALTISALLITAATAFANPTGGVTVTKAGSQSAADGPAENFTGKAQVISRFKGTGSARVSGGIVRFEAGAHTAWHTHPLGQTLIVTEGEGHVQHWEGPAHTIKTGDIVWIPPGVKHWHGASASSGMTHVAIAEALEGKTAEWMEKVTQAQYLGQR